MIETLFVLVLGEGVLGGGGRTFSVGPVSLRMLLFAASVLASFIVALTSTRQRDGLGTAALLVFAFFASLLPGLLIDAANGTTISTIALELQPLLFWLMAPFFAMAIQDVRTAEKAANIILYGGLLVALVTSALMLGLYVGAVNFGRIYLWADVTDELFFRSRTNFFYKGHFFVGTALVFCIVLTPRWWKTMAVVLGLSLILSLTRGLYLAVVIAIAMSFLSARRSFAVIVTIVIATTMVILYEQVLINLIFDPSRLISSQARSQDVAYFLATFDYKTLIFGDGVGPLLNGRRNIENSFIWAIWRFGILGLLFSLTPLFLATRYFLKIPYGSDNHRLASAFFFGMVMLYVVTAFNPFVNNSIGLIYLLCAIFALRRMSAAGVVVPASPAPISALPGVRS